MRRPRQAPLARKRARAVLLFLAVGPGLWWQSPAPSRERTGNLAITPLPLARGPEDAAVRASGAWLLNSDDRRFFGYSALVVEGNRLRAYSDNSRWLEFDPPDLPASSGPEFGAVPGHDPMGHNDLESAAGDPASGQTWLGFEHLNALRRIGPGPQQVASTKPWAMAGFLRNGGAESLVRLPDGRFVVLAERGDWRYPLRRTGLLFARDPVADARAARFLFVPPPGFSPTDAAALRDGRVLILLRGLSLGRWPPFRSKLLIADGADIKPGQVWNWQELADLSGLIPPENYEGLAVERRGSGFVLWLIADANRSAILQRTLLVKLVWNGRTPARPAKAKLRRPAQPS